MVSKELADSWNSSKVVARNRKKRRRKSSTVNLSNEEEVGIGEANEKVEVLLPQGASSYGAMQSAVSFLYRECKVEMPKMMKDSISKYIKGAKRLCRRMKQALALKITEGKIAMTKSVYGFLTREINIIFLTPIHIYSII